MPIKPENKSRYPADWKLIRGRIMKRAQNRCEQCFAENRATIARGCGKDAATYMTESAEVFDALTGDFMGRVPMSNYQVEKITYVVLTVAHLNHAPEDNRDENLKVLCQRCHLAHDHEHHKANAAITRKNRKALADMFELAQ